MNSFNQSTAWLIESPLAMNMDIVEVKKETFDRIWKIVEEIGEEERHFNDIQVRYRNMASAWLLATFGAIGFVV